MGEVVNPHKKGKRIAVRMENKLIGKSIENLKRRGKNELMIYADCNGVADMIMKLGNAFKNDEFC